MSLDQAVLCMTSLYKSTGRLKLESVNTEISDELMMAIRIYHEHISLLSFDDREQVHVKAAEFYREAIGKKAYCKLNNRSSDGVYLTITTISPKGSEKIVNLSYSKGRLLVSHHRRNKRGAIHAI